MKNPIVDFVEEEMRRFREVQGEHENLFPSPNQAPVLYPIPFFGDIRRADVLTMSLNPAWNEFVPARCWHSGLDAGDLTSRLLHYFDLPWPSPHSFFSKWQSVLNQINRSYRINAAHIDLLSAPTLRPRGDGLDADQRQALLNLCDHDAKRLQGVLNLACATKVILVSDFTVGDGANGQWSVWRKAVEHIPSFQSHATGNGQALPILKAGSLNELTALVQIRRDEIREYLATGPRLRHANSS